MAKVLLLSVMAIGLGGGLLLGCQARSSTIVPVATSADAASPQPLDIRGSIGPGDVPSEWLSPRIGFDWAPLDRGEFESAKQQIRALSKAVPPEYFELYPVRVIVLERMRFASSEPVGLSWTPGRTVYLAYDENTLAHGGSRLRYWFYSELGRMMYRRHRQAFPLEQWRAARPAGSIFTEDHTQSSTDRQAMTIWAELNLREGFRVGYGPTTETEVAIYVAAMLSGDAALDRSRAASEEIDTKARLVERFMRLVHPGFTRAWLEAIDRQEGAGLWAMFGLDGR